jgi:hypothetical protein
MEVRLGIPFLSPLNIEAVVIAAKAQVLQLSTSKLNP